MHHNPARPHSHTFTPCFGHQRLATSSSRTTPRLITSVSHLAPRLALPHLALPHLISSRAPPLPYLTSPRTSHFRASSHPCPTTHISRPSNASHFRAPPHPASHLPIPCVPTLRAAQPHSAHPNMCPPRPLHAGSPPHISTQANPGYIHRTAKECERQVPRIYSIRS